MPLHAIYRQINKESVTWSSGVSNYICPKALVSGEWRVRILNFMAASCYSKVTQICPVH